MIFKRLALIGIFALALLSVFAFPAQTKNRIVVSDTNKILLYEYNSETKAFDVVWESVETGLDSKTGMLGMRDIHLTDVDRDGKNELVAMDQFGIFIWGKSGKLPQYYNLKGGTSQPFAHILPMDLDKDGTLEFLTQRNWNYPNRKIEAWKILDNAAVRISDVELQGGSSWSLRAADCDNDKTEDIMTASNLIQVLGWDKAKGFFEKAAFPNLSTLVDVVKAADVNGDGQNEIVASGNSGCFTIYKARKSRGDAEKFDYPVLYQSEDLGGYTQGLEITDIDGDGKNEVLVGVAQMGKEKQDNIFVFEKSGGKTTPGITTIAFKKTFSMPLERSNIPGFVVGDADNDGRNEVIYNSRHVLKFSRDAEGRLQCSALATLGESRAAAAIGPFEPSGKDQIPAPRIIPQALVIDLKDGEIIESGNIYRFWAVLNSTWVEARNVRVRMESLANDVKVLQGESLIPKLDTGKSVDTKASPFLIKPEPINKQTDFELKLVISAEDNYQLTQTYHIVRSAYGGNFILSAVPKFEVKSETLGISPEEDIYKDLGIAHDYFNDDYGEAWPPIEAMIKYKNILVFTEYFISMGTQADKMKALCEAGKRILFHGDRIIEFPPARAAQAKPFYDLAIKYFKSRYVKGYEGEKSVKGKSGDAITDGMSFSLLNRGSEGVPKEFRDFPDILEALPGAEPFLFYPTGEVAAVRVQDKYKLVYLGFSLDDIQSPEAKKELVQRIMAWFNSK